MKISILLYVTLSAFLLTSCFKEEDPLILPSVGENSVTYTFEMSKKYDKQFFFDLSSGTVAGYNDYSVWDVAFDCREGSYYLWINYAQGMQAAKTSSTDFSFEPDLSGLQWKIDAPSGNIDSNAIGKWWDVNSTDLLSKKWVYVLDLGKDKDGNALGYRKMQITDYKDDAYSVKIAKLDGGEEMTYSIQRNPLYNFNYLSIQNNEVLEIEPVKTDWDLLFTRYTTAFYIPVFTPYQVTGVYSNSNHTTVAEVYNLPFENITIADTEQLEFSSDWNAIGYDWKVVDINSGSYTIDAGKIYIVKDVSGSYYKLRFINFINELGENGYPEIEYQKL